jgi:hypothetical protein
MIKRKHNTIIFMHIPKAAGSTLNRMIIYKQYPEYSIFELEFPYMESLNKLKKKSDIEINKIKLIQGHMGFGIHEYLPQSSTYITIIRNPIERVISYYYYILNRPFPHPFCDEVTNKKINLEKMSLKEFICSGLARDMENGQTRRLAGAKGIIYPGQCTPEIFERAKENIQKHFYLVGLVEKFDETLILLKKNLGWRNCYYVKINVNNLRKNSQFIDKKTIELIKEYNYFDIELYDFVSEKFKELSEDKINHKELNLFKFINELIYPYYYRAKRKIMNFILK